MAETLKNHIVKFTVGTAVVIIMASMTIARDVGKWEAKTLRNVDEISRNADEITELKKEIKDELKTIKDDIKTLIERK